MALLRGNTGILLRCFRNDKFSPKSVLYTFIGYNPLHKGYKCYENATGKIHVSRHVFFDETIFPFSKTSIFVSCDNSVTSSSEFLSSSTNNPSSAPSSIGTRSKVGTSKKNKFLDFVTNHTVTHPIDMAFTSLLNITEPKSFKSAIKMPVWATTMKEEHIALKDNDTWDYVPYHPGMNVLGCKWVYKVKLKADGTFERCKARLVAKAYDQLDGVDYSETYSPVVKAPTIKTVLTIVM
ncbi:uncharacterized protein LOC113329876 [Papaver somniferum]|uniref:uncharacterized protein LOC113329876 n=1 Tax=Papaver somniferum TaxID=3469 RepID=UPI000E702170|nr:uncharacterized protein LOC113329876 [Papaver somniferum]